MHDVIIYKFTKLRRSVILLCYKNVLEGRREERRQERQRERMCRYGGIYFGVHEKEGLNVSEYSNRHRKPFIIVGGAR